MTDWDAHWTAVEDALRRSTEEIRLRVSDDWRTWDVTDVTRSTRADTPLWGHVQIVHREGGDHWSYDLMLAVTVPALDRLVLEAFFERTEDGVEYWKLVHAHHGDFDVAAALRSFLGEVERSSPMWADLLDALPSRPVEEEPT